jgi:hypothetical protein
MTMLGGAATDAEIASILRVPRSCLRRLFAAGIVPARRRRRGWFRGTEYLTTSLALESAVRARQIAAANTVLALGRQKSERPLFSAIHGPELAALDDAMRALHWALITDPVASPRLPLIGGSMTFTSPAYWLWTVVNAALGSGATAILVDKVDGERIAFAHETANGLVPIGESYNADGTRDDTGALRDDGNLWLNSLLFLFGMIGIGSHGDPRVVAIEHAGRIRTLRMESTGEGRWRIDCGS